MNQFKAKREKAGITQADVAQFLCLQDKSTISKWETGESLPRAEMLPKIAELYGCTVDELLSDKFFIAPFLMPTGAPAHSINSPLPMYMPAWPFIQSTRPGISDV